MSEKKTSWIDSQAELAVRGVELGTQPKKYVECFLTPTAGRLIIEQDQVKQQSSLIYTPHDKTPRPTTGRVVAVPVDGSLDHWMGHKVLFAQFSGVCLNFKNHPNWRVLQVEEILAIFNKNEDAELDTNVV